MTEVVESQGFEGPTVWECVDVAFSRSMGNGSRCRVAKRVVLANESCFSMSRGEFAEIGEEPSSTGEAGEPV